MLSLKKLYNVYIPASCPDFMGILWIFDLQNLQKSCPPQWV